jgi:hypothetical protein
MPATAVEAITLTGELAPPIAQRVPGSAIFLQHSTVKAMPDPADAKTAPLPWLDENTHNGWLDILGLNA